MQRKKRAEVPTHVVEQIQAVDALLWNLWRRHIAVGMAVVDLDTKAGLNQMEVRGTFTRGNAKAPAPHCHDLVTVEGKLTCLRCTGSLPASRKAAWHSFSCYDCRASRATFDDPDKPQPSSIPQPLVPRAGTYLDGPEAEGPNEWEYFEDDGVAAGRQFRNFHPGAPSDNVQASEAPLAEEAPPARVRLNSKTAPRNAWYLYSLALKADKMVGPTLEERISTSRISSLLRADLCLAGDAGALRTVVTPITCKPLVRGI